MKQYEKRKDRYKLKKTTAAPVLWEPNAAFSLPCYILHQGIVQVLNLNLSKL